MVLEANGHRIKVRFLHYSKYKTIEEFRDLKPWVEWNGLTITALQGRDWKSLMIQNDSREVQVIRLLDRNADARIYRLHPGKQMMLNDPLPT